MKRVVVASIVMVGLVPAFGASSRLSRQTKAQETVSAPAATSIEAARSELRLTTRERSSEVLPTPATVRPRVGAIESPITYKAMQLGVSVSSYRPEGRARVTDLEPFELGSLGDRPMPSLEFRWQPYETGSLVWGGFFSLGYTFHEVNLRAPTGVALPETKLHTLKAAGGLATTYRLPRDSRWSLATLLGLGQLSAVQASRTSFASDTNSLPFGSFSLLAQNRVLNKWTIYGGYEYRMPIRPEPEALILQRHNIMIGLLGSFR